MLKTPTTETQNHLATSLDVRSPKEVAHGASTQLRVFCFVMLVY
jgi:hypothetical protein